MNLADKAFSEIFPEKSNTRILELKYSRAFKPYNANVQYNPIKMTFRLSYDWKGVSEELRIGLIQSLLVKVFKDKRKTINMDLYDNFMRNIGDFARAEELDPVLEESFNRVNEKYFASMLDKPNLVWGQKSFSKLGSYSFGANTITISKALADDEEVLDFVMYHEMLHKKHKFYTKDGRSHHHTKNFREHERMFENPDIEEKLKNHIRKKRWSLGSKERKTKKGLLEWFFG